MARQTIVWTALPNGMKGSNLCISVFVSPQLGTYSISHTDFVNWPAAINGQGFKVHFSGESTPRRAIAVAARPGPPPPGADEDLWKAIFEPTMRVKPFKFDRQGYVKRKMRSYPIGRVKSLVKKAYKQVGRSAPEDLPSTVMTRGEETPALYKLFADLQSDESTDKKFAAEEKHRRSLNSVYKGQRLAPEWAPSMSNAMTMYQARRFHKPPYLDKLRDTAASGIKALGKKDVPGLEFHEIVSALTNYPAIMRRLGLVIDLEIPLEGAARIPVSPTAAGKLRTVHIIPPWEGGPGQQKQASTPKTAYYFNRKRRIFRPAARPGGDLEMTPQGLLRLNDKSRFEVIQTDVDGAALKLTEFANTTRRLLRRRVGVPEKAGMPTLRSAGFSVGRTGRALRLHKAFKRSADVDKKMRSALKKSRAALRRAAEPTLYYDDVIRGWRVDVLDGNTGKWRSLNERIGSYYFPKLPGPAQDRVIKVEDLSPGGEEGVTQAGVVSYDDKDLYVHESLFRWDGWSLSAPRPGRILVGEAGMNPGDVGTEPFEQLKAPDNPAVPGVNMEVRFRAKPGSLPRLRFGKPYRIRARAVDMAGNSVSLEDAPPTPATRAEVYKRYEPVSSPVVIPLVGTDIPLGRDGEPQARFTEGESLENMVIRSDRGKKAADYLAEFLHYIPTGQHIWYSDVNERHIAPPKTSQLMAETHSKFDAAGGMNPNHSLTFDIAKRECGSFAEYEPDPIERLPYLPDPLATGAALINLPGVPKGRAHRRSFDQAWPDAFPFRIRIEEGSGKPRWVQGSRILHVFLPKAEMATVRYSCYLEKRSLGLMGVWDLIKRPQLVKRAAEGRLWMLTPSRTLRLVHAVQRPLKDPEFYDFGMGKRNAGDTFAGGHGPILVDGKSTGKLEVGARWSEWIDVLADDGPTEISKAAEAFEAKVAYDDEYVNFHYRKNSKGWPIARHEFGDTKYRYVEYSTLATTRFREYFPRSITDDLKNITVKGEVKDYVIASSARPAAPDILYVVPIFKWKRSKKGGAKVTSRRVSGGLRVYMNRPWFTSGNNEMLGVVLTGEKVTDKSPLKPYVTQWGTDPIWKTRKVADMPTAKNFKGAATRHPDTGWTLDPKNLPLTEVPGKKVSVVPYHMAPQDNYDQERRLWFCDIHVDSGKSYWPFIRLALARYQPASLWGLHLSPVVLADFAQILPDRSVSVSPSKRDPRKLHVAVSGIGPQQSAAHWERNKVGTPVRRIPTPEGVRFVSPDPPYVRTRVEVEVQVPDSDPKNLMGWKTTDAVEVKHLKPRAKIPILWLGQIILPKRPSSRNKFRLLIKEYEQFFTDNTEIPWNMAERLVYAETVNLEPGPA